MAKKQNDFLYNSIPEFLYEDSGHIRVGVHGDSDVTKEWKKWLDNHLQLIKEKYDINIPE